MTKIIINYDETTGKLGLEGPIDNKILAYGLLELAKEGVRLYGEQNQRLIQPVAGMLVPPSNKSS